MFNYVDYCLLHQSTRMREDIALAIEIKSTYTYFVLDFGFGPLLRNNMPKRDNITKFS